MKIKLYSARFVYQGIVPAADGYEHSTGIAYDEVKYERVKDNLWHQEWNDHSVYYDAEEDSYVYSTHGRLYDTKPKALQGEKERLLRIRAAAKQRCEDTVRELNGRIDVIAGVQEDEAGHENQ